MPQLVQGAQKGVAVPAAAELAHDRHLAAVPLLHGGPYGKDGEAVVGVLGGMKLTPGVIQELQKFLVVPLLTKLKAGGVKQEDWDLWIDIATAPPVAPGEANNG